MVLSFLGHVKVEPATKAVQLSGPSNTKSTSCLKGSGMKPPNSTNQASRFKSHSKGKSEGRATSYQNDQNLPWCRNLEST